jgi:hypothetical protein
VIAELVNTESSFLFSSAGNLLTGFEDVSALASIVVELSFSSALPVP